MSVPEMRTLLLRITSRWPDLAIVEATAALAHGFVENAVRSTAAIGTWKSSLRWASVLAAVLFAAGPGNGLSRWHTECGHRSTRGGQPRPSLGSQPDPPDPQAAPADPGLGGSASAETRPGSQQSGGPSLPQPTDRAAGKDCSQDSIPVSAPVPVSEAGLWASRLRRARQPVSPSRGAQP